MPAELAYPALPAFTLALLALFLKTSLTSAVQIVTRIRTRVFLVPEDATAFGLRPREAEVPLIQRCTNVWRNDAENLPLFLALALSYVLLGAPASAGWLFALFVALRYLHTLAYLLRRQPWRAVFYLGGMLVCWLIAVRLVLLLAAGAGA